VIGANRARGAEGWARASLGGWDGTVGYSRATSTLDVRGLRYSAPWERLHTARASISFRTSAFRSTAQYTRAGGAPVTRYFAGTLHCAESGSCRWTTPPSAGPAAERQSASTGMLDVGVEWAGPASFGVYGAYLQVSNLLGARGAGTYLDSRGWCAPPRRDLPPTCDPTQGRWDHITDKSLPGLPRVVLAGVRMTF
jgi:hypothetical protein